MTRFSDAEWAELQRRIPIACVDVLPVRWSPDAGTMTLRVGLIERWYPEAGWPGARRVWCVLGGRQRMEETIPEAIVAQLRATLGCAPVGPLPAEPITVVEYLPVPREREAPDDPRRHAIGPLYAVELPEAIRPPFPPGSDALGFRWFDPDDLPEDGAIGFHLAGTLRRCVQRLRALGPPGGRTNPRRTEGSAP
jgi:hypothetical protein